MKDFEIQSKCLIKYNGEDTDVVIPHGVTKIGNWAFYDRGDIKSVTLPDTVTEIGESAFSWCSGLTEIILPESVKTIGGWAFDGCSGLLRIVVPDGVENIGRNLFDNCKSLCYNEYRGGHYIGSKNNPYFILVKAESADIETVEIHDGAVFILGRAFASCTKLKSVAFPDSVIFIGARAFSCCSSLSDVTLPARLKTIGERTFEGCTELLSVTVPDSVQTVCQGAFYSCTALKSVKLGAGVNTIGECAFYDCPSLEEVNVPDGVIEIRPYTFYRCKSLKRITLPESVKSVGCSAFAYCVNLEDIDISDGVTLAENAFDNCASGYRFIWYIGSKYEKFRETWRWIFGDVRKYDAEEMFVSFINDHFKTFINAAVTGNDASMFFKLARLKRQRITVDQLEECLAKASGKTEITAAILQYMHENYTPEEIENHRQEKAEKALKPKKRGNK